jgi:hypothetical protein
MHMQWCVIELSPELLHLIDEESQAIDLNLGSRESIKDGAIAVGFFDQLTQDEVQYFAVTDKATGFFNCAGFRAI